MRRRKRFAAGLLLCFFTGAESWAQQTYDDASLSDVWDTTTMNWDFGFSTWANTPGSIANFGGTGEAITVDTVNAAGMNFNSNGYVLNGGTISLDTGSIINVGTGVTTTINSGLTGTDFSKAGSGTLNLDSTNGFPGAFTNQLGSTNLLGAGAYSMGLTIAGGQVSIQNTATNNFSSINLNAGFLRVLSNSGALGTVDVNVNGNSTFATELGSTPVSIANNFVISSGAALSVLRVDSGYNSVTLAGNVSGVGSLLTASTGTTEVNGNVSLAGLSPTVLSNFGVDSAAVMNLNAGATISAGNLSRTGNGGNLGQVNINGANVTVENVQISNTGAVQNEHLVINSGSLTAKYFNIGAGGNNAGRITQNDGLVTVQSGAFGFRLGHWNNGATTPGSRYDLIGGTLDASSLGANTGEARFVNVGWDGQGLMTVGGGAGLATLKAAGVRLDRNRSSVAAPPTNFVSTLTILNNGLVEIGALGSEGQGNDFIRIDGGTIRGTDSSTWAAELDVAGIGTSTVEVASGATVAHSGIISGLAETTLQKTGDGTLNITSAATYNGKTVVNGGTLRVSSTMRNTSSLEVNNGATLEMGAINILVAGHGAAVDGTRTITANSSTLLMNGSMDSRIGNVNLNNGSTWTSNRGLAAWDVLVADVTDSAPVPTLSPATISVTGTGLSTMNGTGGVHLQGVQNFNVADTVSGSSVDLNVDMVLAGPGNAGGAAGGINKVGAGTMALNGNNTYNGATNVNVGTLLVNGTHTNGGSYSVAAGAVLGGNGTIANSNVDIAVGGILAPGNELGTMTINQSLNMNGIYAWQIKSLQQADSVTVGGDLTLGGMLSINLLPHATFERFDKFTLFAYQGNLSGGFSKVLDGWQVEYMDKAPGLNGTPLVGSWKYVTLKAMESRQRLTLMSENYRLDQITSVPEPSSLAFVGVSLLLLAGRRSRNESFS